MIPPFSISIKLNNEFQFIQIDYLDLFTLITNLFGTFSFAYMFLDLII